MAFLPITNKRQLSLLLDVALPLAILWFFLDLRLWLFELFKVSEQLPFWIVCLLASGAKMSSTAHHTQDYLDANKGPTILGVVLTVSILSTIFVVGRVYTRKRILGALHLDDWFTVCAVVSHITT